MPHIKINIYIILVEAICICVYIVRLPPDTLPPWRQFGWRQCDLRPRKYVCLLKRCNFVATGIQITHMSSANMLKECYKFGRLKCNVPERSQTTVIWEDICELVMLPVSQKVKATLLSDVSGLYFDLVQTWNLSKSLHRQGFTRKTVNNDKCQIATKQQII